VRRCGLCCAVVSRACIAMLCRRMVRVSCTHSDTRASSCSLLWAPSLMMMKRVYTHLVCFCKWGWLGTSRAHTANASFLPQVPPVPPERERMRRGWMRAGGCGRAGAGGGAAQAAAAAVGVAALAAAGGRASGRARARVHAAGARVGLAARRAPAPRRRCDAAPDMRRDASCRGSACSCPAGAAVLQRTRLRSRRACFSGRALPSAPALMLLGAMGRPCCPAAPPRHLWPCAWLRRA